MTFYFFEGKKIILFNIKKIDIKSSKRSAIERIGGGGKTDNYQTMTGNDNYSRQVRKKNLENQFPHIIRTEIFPRIK